jgi:hypothetical protein
VTYELDTSIYEKPVVNVDDVYLIFYYYWALNTSVFPDGRQRLQFALLIPLSAYSATRPGALIYVARNVKAEKTPYIIDEGDSGCEEDSDVEQDSRVTEDSEEEVDSVRR